MFPGPGPCAVSCISLRYPIWEIWALFQSHNFLFFGPKFFFPSIISTWLIQLILQQFHHHLSARLATNNIPMVDLTYKQQQLFSVSKSTQSSSVLHFIADDGDC